MVLLVLAAGYFGVGLLVASRLSAPEPDPVPPAPASLDAREIRFQSTDGVELAGWWSPNGDASRAAVLVHGWGGNRTDQHIPETARIYRRAGYAVLMPDLRGHGESGGERRTLGYREVRDVRGALAWLDDRGFEPRETVLHGWSMGGAAVVRAAPGTGVSAVVEEAAYADLPLLLETQLPENSGLPAIFNPSTMLMAKLFLDFDAWAVQPEEDAAELSEEGVPLLIIHSTTDETTPFEHARMLKRAYPGAELWKISGYDHAEAYTHPGYRERLLDFLDDAVVKNAV